MDWVWSILPPLTNEPTRIVRLGFDGQNPCERYCIEIIRRDHSGDTRWQTEQMVLTADEFHQINR